MDHTISKNNKIDEGGDIYLEKQKEEQTKITYERASIFDLYKYAEVKFIILLIVGTINSIVWGILFPLKFLVTREIFGSIHIDRENEGFTGLKFYFFWISQCETINFVLFLLRLILNHYWFFQDCILLYRSYTRSGILVYSPFNWSRNHFLYFYTLIFNCWSKSFIRTKMEIYEINSN